MFEDIQRSAREMVRMSPLNRVQAEDAMNAALVGLKLFDEPVFAVGDAADALFARLKEPQVVHPEVMLPDDWLPGARRVISYFLPFTQAVKASNSLDFRFPSDEWLHGRIEGQMFLDHLGAQICAQLSGWGYSALTPSSDARFRYITPFISNWSERHAAYICGLGTFSLNKGLITEKGMAGRIGSVVTTCDLPVTLRPYSDLYEYCTICRACEPNCPVSAIDAAHGMHAAKDHAPCKQFQDGIKDMPPCGLSGRMRFGCGKCQVGVPCQDGIPGRK